MMESLAMIVYFIAIFILEYILHLTSSVMIFEDDEVAAIFMSAINAIFIAVLTVEVVEAWLIC